MITWPKRVQRLAVSIFEMIRLGWQAHPLSFVGIILLTTLQGFMPLATAWIIKLLFDLLARRLSGEAMAWSQLAWPLLAQAILMTAGQLFTPASKYLRAELERQLTLTIQRQVYQKINSFAGLACFEIPELHDTIRLAQQGAQFGSGQALSLLTRFIQNTVTLVSFLAILAPFPILAGAVLLSALPQLYTQIRLSQKRVGLAHRTSPDERQQFYYGVLLSSVHAAKDVRLFGLGDYFLDKLLHLYRKVHRAQRSQQKQELVWEYSLGILASLVTAGAFVTIIFEAFAGRLSLGDITLYLAALRGVQGVTRDIIVAISGLNQSALFYACFRSLLALPGPLSQVAVTRPTPKLSLGIELCHLAFRYNEQHPWVLRDFNLFIPAGQCVALVGLNGAGKTTLVKLLTRLYDPSEGQVLWDGMDIREFDPADLRQRIGVVLQDFMRYDMTAQENIGLGDVRRVTDIERVRQAAFKSGIHDVIEGLPHGYQTQISLIFAHEVPGVDLSAGQWQKIATARMLMRDAELLILDEPTAALDAQAEYEIFNNFARLIAGRTTLLISHRFSTARMADVIAVLENGKITEYGTHDNLMTSGGTYARLYTIQAERYTSEGAQQRNDRSLSTYAAAG